MSENNADPLPSSPATGLAAARNLAAHPMSLRRPSQWAIRRSSNRGSRDLRRSTSRDHNAAEACEEDFSSAADAFSSIAIISMLVFGFAISSFVTLTGLSADRVSSTIICMFACSMTITAGLSGYATIFMTLTYYYLKRLDNSDKRLRIFYLRTATGRRAARWSTWASLVVYLSSLGALGFEMLPMWAASASACCVVAGAVIMVFTTTTLHQMATDDDPKWAELYPPARTTDGDFARSGTLLSPGSGRLSVAAAAGGSGRFSVNSPSTRSNGDMKRFSRFATTVSATAAVVNATSCSPSTPHASNVMDPDAPSSSTDY